MLERWLAKNCLTLGELDRERIADIYRKLAVTADEWPQRSKSRARRKVARTKRSVDIRTLPSPAVMAAAIDAIVTQQPGSKTYRVMTAVAYCAGLRPSEVVMLRGRSVELPVQG